MSSNQTNTQSVNSLTGEPLVSIKVSDVQQWVNLADAIGSMNQMGMTTSSAAYNSQLSQKMKEWLQNHK